MPPQKGKQPTKGAKQIIEENSSTVKFYRNMSLGAVALYSTINLNIFGAGLTPLCIVLNIISLVLHGCCYNLMEYMTRGTYTADGQLIDPGVDLNMEGGMGEHIKDIVILTSVTQILSLFSFYFWLLLLLIPLRAMWLLWKHVLGPWFFQEAPADNEQDDKKKKKMERKMKRFQ